MSASARDALTDYLYDAFNDPPHGWSRIDCATEARDILTALSAAGFVIVPREPTEEMIKAYYHATDGTHPTAKMNQKKALVGHHIKATKRCRAMLSAAEGKK